MADPELDMHRAREARALLDNDMFKDSIYGLKLNCILEMASSKLDDDDGRRRSRYKLQALEDFLLALQNHLETGKLLDKSAEQEQELKDFRAQNGLS